MPIQTASMLEIEGARPLHGALRVSGSKNACLPLLAAALLADGPTVLHRVPDLSDIRVLCTLLEHLGARAERRPDGSLRIDPAGLRGHEVPWTLMSKMRASYYAMGPLLARLGRAHLALPGGCAIGDRPMDLHLVAFRALGAAVTENEGYIFAKAAEGLRGSRFSLLGASGTSVGATCNALMACVLASGTTTIEHAAREPEVVELVRFLRAMGARIAGEGTGTLVVDGVRSLRGIEYEAPFDRIEAITWAVAAAVTDGDVLLEGVEAGAMGPTLAALERWGADLWWETPNNLRVRRGTQHHPLHLVTEPFPGFPTDAQSVFMVLLALTAGESTLRETIYPERFKLVPHLVTLGAQIRLPEKGRAVITGVPRLHGGAVRATDLRAAAALIVAGLAAEGTTQVHDLEHAERGYELIEEKIRSLGGRALRLETAAIPEASAGM